jgi:hypothetical protein
MSASLRVLGLDSDFDAILDAERSIPRLPAAVRERALARARASVAESSGWAGVGIDGAHRRSAAALVLLCLGAIVAVGVLAAGGAALGDLAYEIRAHRAFDAKRAADDSVAKSRGSRQF